MSTFQVLFTFLSHDNYTCFFRPEVVYFLTVFYINLKVTVENAGLNDHNLNILLRSFQPIRNSLWIIATELHSKILLVIKQEKHAEPSMFCSYL